MQRQSLGSPGRERLSLSHSDDAVTSSHDPKRRESSSPPDVTIPDADEIKPVKPHSHSKSPPHHHHPDSTSFIHLIPALVLFCFLLLYLSSHDPSPQDMAQFHGFTLPDQITEMNDDHIGESMSNKNNNKVLERSNAFVIRSLRNIQQKDEENIIIQRDSRPYRSHRKLADF